jgi:hypothetical protein
MAARKTIKRLSEMICVGPDDDSRFKPDWPEVNEFFRLACAHAERVGYVHESPEDVDQDAADILESAARSPWNEPMLWSVP